MNKVCLGIGSVFFEPQTTLTPSGQKRISFPLHDAIISSSSWRERYDKIKKVVKEGPPLKMESALAKSPFHGGFTAAELTAVQSGSDNYQALILQKLLESGASITGELVAASRAATQRGDGEMERVLMRGRPTTCEGFLHQTFQATEVLNKRLYYQEEMYKVFQADNMFVQLNRFLQLENSGSVDTNEVAKSEFREAHYRIFVTILSSQTYCQNLGETGLKQLFYSSRGFFSQKITTPEEELTPLELLLVCQKDNPRLAVIMQFLLRAGAEKSIKSEKLADDLDLDKLHQGLAYIYQATTKN